MNRLALLPAIAPLVALAACNSSTEGADPGPMSQDEAEALDDAASMLDEQRIPEEQSETENSEGETE